MKHLSVVLILATMLNTIDARKLYSQPVHNLHQSYRNHGTNNHSMENHTHHYHNHTDNYTDSHGGDENLAIFNFIAEKIDQNGDGAIQESELEYLFSFIAK